MQKRIINPKEFLSGCVFFGIITLSCLISICGVIYIAEKLSTLLFGDWF